MAIDEIQRVPELTLAIKRSVDAGRRPGSFLLTGAANLLQVPRLADSLAGRMECLYLQPFTEAEKERSAGRFLHHWLPDMLEIGQIDVTWLERVSETLRPRLQALFDDARVRMP